MNFGMCCHRLIWPVEKYICAMSIIDATTDDAGEWTCYIKQKPTLYGAGEVTGKMTVEVNPPTTTTVTTSTTTMTTTSTSSTSSTLAPSTTTTPFRNLRNRRAKNGKFRGI